MATAKIVIITAAASLAGLALASQAANAQCYGYNCSWNGAYSQYRAPNAYGYVTSASEAQSYFPNVVLGSDVPNLYQYGYTMGYRDAYGCLWLDKQCPRN